MSKYLLFSSLFFALLVSLGSCKKLLPINIFPYSMVQYQQYKFIDQTEVTVEQYAEFIYDGNEDRKPNAELIKNYKHYQVFYPANEPDSLFRAFGKIDYYNLPVPFEYFDTLNYPELRQILDFPITGISHEDAIAYCNWRTKKYNANNTSHTKKQIEFVLPDKIIFMEEQPVDPEKYSPAEIFTVKSQKHATVNAKRVFGLKTNVAEMTASPNKFFGQTNVTAAPNSHIGFRCVGLVNE